MKKPATMAALEEFGRVRLSKHFFMRDFLYSEISSFYSIPNIPDDPDLAIVAGRGLCEHLLEPLQDTFGRIAIRSAFRCSAVNEFGNKNRLNCSSNAASYGDHIWDHRDKNGRMGATACIVIPWYLERYEATQDWRPLAWFIHDHFPYSDMYFFPKLCAFNLTWCEVPERVIYSYIPPHLGYLTRPGLENHEGNHAEWYEGFPAPAVATAVQPVAKNRTGMDRTSEHD